MKKRIFFDLIVLFILGLIPLLWFKGNTIIVGHDAGLPFDPVIHFIDRFYVWSQRFSIGTDQSSALLGAFFIHGIEAALVRIGFSVQWQQKIQFIFWFLLPGLTMYFFVIKTWSKKKYLPLIAAIIYMINFYLLQGWFVAERTKFSIYVALPLIMYFMLGYLIGKKRLLPSILLSGLTLGIFNGGGSIPLYGGLMFAIIISYVYVFFIFRNFAVIKRVILYSLGLGIIYFLLNAYWLIPYIFYLSGFYGRDLANAGGSEGALTWARYLSSGSTFINLLRGQGIPEWYLNQYHAYAISFLSNPILIIVSFLFPFLAFLPLILIKNKRDTFYIYLLICIGLVGILFSAGPQSQLGIIFELFVKFIPGFAMFRSAFYKFNYIVWFAYAILIGYSLDAIFSFFEQKLIKYSVIFTKVVLLVFTIGYLFYHYPLLDGSFFDYSHEPGKELTTRVEVPNYIFEFGKWINTQNPNKRYLVMPQLSDTTYISYQWGYWSIAPITSLLTRNSFVLNSALISENERLLMNQMYAAFIKEDIESFKDFADVFAIDGIVLQEDYDWQNKTWGTINPERYKNILNKYPLFKHEKTFGKWLVYDLNDRNKSLRINSSSKLNYLQGELANIVSFPYFDPKAPLYSGDLKQKNNDYYVEQAKELFLAPECVLCDLQSKIAGFKFYNPKILPGSIFYPYVSYQESKVKQQSNDFMSLLNYYITVSNRRIIEAKWMVDTDQEIDNLLHTLERYKQSLVDLKNHLQKSNWSEDIDVENEAAQIITNHILQQVNLIDSVYKKDNVGFIQRSLLAQSYNEIIEIEKLARDKLWITEDMIHKKYTYNLPTIGNYEVYLKKSSLTDPIYNIDNTQITFKNINNILKPTKEIGNDWFYMGDVNLINKKLYLTLIDGTVTNLLDNASIHYPDGKEGILPDKNFYRFTTDSLNKCFYYNVDNLDTTERYIVTFKYRNFSDKHNLGFIFQQADEQFLKYSIRDSYLANSWAWTEYTKIISIKEPDIRLNFCNGFLSLSELSTKESKQALSLLSNDQTILELSDINLHKVSYPNIILYKKQKTVNNQDDIVNFSKINPVTYTIDLKDNNKKSIIMRESFGKYWRVCNEKNECLPFDDKSHFETSGFANAWYFDKSFGKKLTLYYYPQTMFVIGVIITVISFIIVLGGICLTVLRRK